jgi:predicted enzyme related to lactoylglutathione lyase
MSNSTVIFGSVAPQFIVPDVVATAEYYRDVLGFEIRSYFLDPPVHAIVGRGMAEVFFGKAAGAAGVSNRQRKPAGIDAYFHIDGLDDFVREITSQRAKVLEGPVTRVYQMREVTVEDCNGFVLVFGEAV